MRLFDVMEAVWRLNRAGIQVTTHACSSALEMSKYRFRKIAHSAAEIGLITWYSVAHRRNVNKRLYRLTDKGKRTLAAYQGDDIDVRDNS